MQNHSIDASLLKKMFRQGTINLTNHKEEVNALNVFPVPDGDTGTNMSLTMSGAMEGLKDDLYTVEKISAAVSKGSLMGARGNSGVILSQIFRGFAKGCVNQKVLDTKTFCKALKHAQESAYSAVLKPVEGTILTVIREIAEHASTLKKADITFEDLFESIIKIGDEAVKRTPDLLPVLKQAGVVDSGGVGLMYFFKGMNDALNGLSSDINVDFQSNAQSHFNTEDITFGYCTEFIIKTEKEDVKDLRQVLEGLGDSLVFVRDEDIIKIHVHTDNPGVALEESLKVGQVIKIKIENMRQQHTELTSGIHNQIDKKAHDVESLYNLHESPYAFVVVSPGEGFSRIIKDLGVDYIISGGQTMNPSTQDFINQIEKIKADHILLFPNNSNIIMAANQAASVSDKDVRVIPTCTMPECISSLIAFEPDADLEQNIQTMNSAISNVRTISVTHSIRDTNMDENEIKEGDYIAVSGKDISANGQKIDEVVINSLKKLTDEHTELITIYHGQNVNTQEAQEIESKIGEFFPNYEIASYYGGQPVYYYIIAVE